MSNLNAVGFIPRHPHWAFRFAIEDGRGDGPPVAFAAEDDSVVA